LADSVHFSSIEAKNNFAYGLLFGLILSMILYNFFIFVSTKSISYLYYIFYVLFFGLFISGLEGFNQRFLFHNNPWFSNNGQAFWMGLTQFFGALFTLSYLKMDKSMGVYYKALRLSCYIGFAISLSSFVLPFSFNLKAFILHGFFLIIAIFSSTLYRIKTKYRPAIYYILSMTLTLIGGGITALMPLGLVPSNFFVRNAFTIGNSIQFILLSMGLADRFNLIQEEALKNEKKAKKLQESYAKDLEKEVKKQTKTAVEEKEKAVKSEREVSGLLHNMKQAVFAIDREGIIIPPVSKFSQNIFEKEIQGQSIYETLFKDLEKGSELFNKIIFILKMCVGADSLQYDISADILPRKIIMKNNAEEKRSIQISYSPILDESDIVLKLMLVIEDVTELEALEKEVIESQEASAIKVQKMQEIVSNNKKEIKVFIREAILNLESAFKSIKGSQISEFLRAAHTLKGNSRIYNLSKLSEEIHHIETHLIQLKNNETEQNEGSLEKIYNQLNEKAYNYINLSKEIFGHDVDETVVVQGEDFFEIEKTIFFSTLEEVKKILNSRDMPDIIEMLKRIEYDEFKKSLFGLHKIINKISFALKKDLSLHIKGDEIYLDKKLTSIIKETLIHIIQNSADHGIKEKGNIEIIVLNKAKNYHITISDDGQGIDENIIYKKAIEKGLIKVEGTENFKKEDSLNLIFLPGFSTKNVATEFSGRGVGMDVVKTNIADLGGSIQIESEIGEGTLFKIEIPKPV
jgi:signal transduction histidine kinase